MEKIFVMLSSVVFISVIFTTSIVNCQNMIPHVTCQNMEDTIDANRIVRENIARFQRQYTADMSKVENIMKIEIRKLKEEYKEKLTLEIEELKKEFNDNSTELKKELTDKLKYEMNNTIRDILKSEMHSTNKQFQKQINETTDLLKKEINETTDQLKREINDAMVELTKERNRTNENAGYLNGSYDCWELHRKGHNKSGIYTIYPWKLKNKPVKVFCDMDTSPGGFTVFQRRLDGSISFDRTFQEYKNGFGNVSSEYWLGNEVLHILTTENKNMLYVKLDHTDGRSFYQTYAGFAISDENDDFRLSIELPTSGTAGDSLITGRRNINGQTFKTPDRDSSKRNCATSFSRGGWWFIECYQAYLNGVYGSSSWANPWETCIDSPNYFKASAMMIRRKC